MITCFKDMAFASASHFQAYSRGSKHISTLHIACQGRISPKALWLKYRIRTGNPLWISTNTYQDHQSSRKHSHIKVQADFSLEVKIWKPLQNFRHRRWHTTAGPWKQTPQDTSFDPACFPRLCSWLTISALDAATSASMGSTKDG